MPRPELEKIDGFIDNIRYRSLTWETWMRCEGTVGHTFGNCDAAKRLKMRCLSDVRSNEL